jgi:tetratricopeptide (TPR) repeat protein
LPRKSGETQYADSWILISSWELGYYPLGFVPYSAESWRKQTADTAPVRRAARALGIEDGLSPAPFGRAEGWGLVATTTCDLPAWKYRVRVVADDGARMWVDRIQVVDSWQGTGVKLGAADVTLGSGSPTHELRVEYFQTFGGFKLWCHFEPVSEVATAWAQNLLHGYADLDKRIAQASATLREKPDDLPSLMDRAHCLARRGRFAEAVPDFERQKQIDPQDHWKYYVLACAAAWAGNQDVYRAAAGEFLERFKSSDRPEIRERIAKIGLLVPSDASLVSKLEPLSEWAVQKGGDLLPWFELTRGLVEYRAGRFERAARILQNAKRETMDYQSQAQLLLVLAMTRHQLGQREAAKALLAEADEVMSAQGARQDLGDLGSSWHDWVIVQLWRAEAGNLIRAH